MAKKKDDGIIGVATETELIHHLDKSDIDGLDHDISTIKHGIEITYNCAEEAAARARDSRDVSNSLRDEIVKLINVVRDVDFRKTEFELGDIVLAKNPEMKRYKRGKIVGFGTGRRILVATIFGHLIATESDTFLIKRQPKGDK